MQPSIFNKTILKALSITAVIGTLLAAPGVSRADVTLTEIAYGEDDTIVYAVSNDGVAVGVTGDYGDGTQKGFYWDNGTKTDLGSNVSTALYISGDGNYVTGYDLSGSKRLGAIWNIGADTETTLGTLNDDNTKNFSMTFAVSDNGTIAVGYTNNTSGKGEGFIYNTETDSMTGIGNLGGGSSVAYDVSSDGTKVAGYSTTIPQSEVQNAYEAFIYDTATNTMTSLGILDGYDTSYAYNISGDGTTIVGTCDTHDNTVNDVKAFVWTKEDGMTGLDSYYEGGTSFASEGTDDGSIIVGFHTDDEDGRNKRAALWVEEEDGDYTVYDLWTLLEEEGVDLSGWASLTQISGISNDGSYIVGVGYYNDDDTMVSWILKLDDMTSFSAVPVPGTFMLLVSGLVGLAGLRRRS